MKKIATFSYITFLFLCLPFLKAEAQTLEMVVNEYYNESFPSQEWSELLVVSNGTNLGINLSDYVYTDNNEGQASWQGGVIFKSIPLWQNVKEGTVIVIWHRDLPTGVTRDVSIADGYIEVSANDSEVFEKFLQNPGSVWDDVALNIAEGGDILQIRNSSTGNSVAAHVHALAHKTITGSSYSLIFNANKPIINTPSSCANGSSNAVIPGRTTTDYSGANKAQIVSGSNVTKGLPNKNTQYPLTNYQFWEELREPEWPTANSLQSTYIPTGIKLDWTSMANVSSREGYVILRAKSFPSTIPNFDGYIFQKGDPFPSFPGITVVDILPATANTYTENFTSSFELPCGEFFEYRIYPFRYGKDDQNKDNTLVPFSARGRSYNEDQFAKVTVSRPAFPAPPQITTFGGGAIFVFCEGQNLTLFANPSDATSYQWLKDGTAIAGATGNTYNAVSEGRYAVRAFNAEGCAEQSADITVTKSAAPEAQIIPSTVIKLCSSDDTTLTASPDLPGYMYQWLDGAGNPIVNENKVRFKTDKPGSYRVVVTSDAGCSDTSAPTVIRLFEPSISLKTADVGIPVETLEFGKLGECESSKELSVVFETESADAFIVILTAPDGFSVSPTTFTLSKSGPQVVKVTFSPLESKIYSSFLTAEVAGECSFKDQYRLTGEKANVNVAALKSSVDYPVMASCEAQKVTESVRIVNSSSDAVNFLAPTVQAPFTVIAPTFPRPVLKGDTLTIIVEYTPTPGLSSRILTVPYTSAACTSSVNISLTANTIQPSITSAVGEVDFKNLEGCTKVKDTTISITNATDYPLTIPVQQLDANFSVVQAVSLAARETQSVKVRFTPSTTGQITSTVLLKADKCPEIANISLVLKGSSGAPAIQSIPEYEAISNCTPAFKTIQSKVTTTSPVTIENITVPAGFTVSGIDVGQVVNGMQPFDITFAPPADGVYDEVLSVQFSGCPDPNTILLKGKKSTLNFGFKETEIDFGTVQPNTTAPPKTATLVNTGNDSITVNKIDPPAPFKIVSTSPSLPARLAPGQEMTVTFEYAPTQEKNDSHAAAFEACFGQKTILLKGIAQYPAGTGKAVVSLPVLRGAPGSVIEIPVIIANEANSFALEKAAIREISIRLTYDPMLLMPQSVRIANGTQGFDQATITELSPGTAELLLRSTGGSVITSGTAAIISAKVLLGSNPSTSIVFSNITPVGNSLVVFTQQDGEFILDDSCSAGRRIGGFSAQFMLRVSGAAPVTDDKAEITFETGADEILSLELYNSFGQHVKTIFKGTVQAGQYVNEIPLHDLANGAYHIIMQTPTNIATAKLVIAR